MNYIKKIWNYQKLLLSSMQLGNIDLTVTSSSANIGCLSILLLMVMYGFLIYVFNGSNVMFLIIIGVAYTYGVVTSKRNLYVLAPVTKRFALFNLYLLPIVITVWSYLTLSVGLLIAFLLLWAVFTILKIPQDTAPPPSEVIASVGGYKTALFCVLFIAIVLLVTISITVIRARKTRLISLTTFMIITIGLLFWLKQTIPSTPPTYGVYFSSDLSNLLPGFENMAHSGLILICMAVVLSVIAPLSIKFAYQEYMRDKTNKPI